MYNTDFYRITDATLNKHHKSAQVWHAFIHDWNVPGLFLLSQAKLIFI